MAVAARQVRVAAGSDHVVAVQRDTLVDPETGVAAQVEKTTIAVDLGDGNITDSSAGETEDSGCSSCTSKINGK